MTQKDTAVPPPQSTSTPTPPTGPDQIPEPPRSTATPPHQARILVVEDEVKLAGFIRHGLHTEGYVIDLAHSLAQARVVMQAAWPAHDLLILDWSLPDGDGLALTREVRAAGQAMPILILTGREEVADRVRALDGGADDYILKPFALAELAARVRGHLRRSATSESVLRVQDLVLDLVRRTAARGGARVPLTDKEFAVLAYLAQNAGRAVSREELLQRVWGIEGAVGQGANAVEVQISRLRDKLEQPQQPPLILTVRKRGYVLSWHPLGIGTAP